MREGTWRAKCSNFTGCKVNLAFAGFHPHRCACAARQVTVTVMPTQGLAAMTQAVANDITGYFQRYAVVRAQQAGALRRMHSLEYIDSACSAQRRS